MESGVVSPLSGPQLHPHGLVIPVLRAGIAGSTNHDTSQRYVSRDREFQNNLAHAPPLVRRCFEYICERALNTPGLFTVAASLTLVKELHEAFSADRTPRLSDVSDPHVISELLLFYLRERQEPLLCYQVYSQVIELAKRAQESRTDPDVSSLQAVVNKLPHENQVVLDIILELMERLLSQSELNRSSAISLVQAFSPVLCKPVGSAYKSLRHMEAMPHISEIVLALLKHHKLLRFSQKPETISGPIVTTARRREDSMTLGHLVSRAVNLFMTGDSQGAFTIAMRDVIASGKDLATQESNKSQGKSSDYLTIDDLMKEKRSVKQQLKKFDGEYKKKHGHEPTRKDKEPIRHLYVRYNEVKNLINQKLGGAGSSAESKSGGHDSDRDMFTSDGEESKVVQKRTLQAKLGLFQQSFEEKHDRKISTKQDRAPVEEDYLKYQSLKNLK